MLFLLLSTVFGECVQVSNSICSPLSGSIDLDALSSSYGIRLNSTQDWESVVTEITSGSDSQAKMWQKWAMCDGYHGQMLQYYRSYVCLTDMFDISSSCGNALPPMCESVCDAYGLAVNALLKSDACPLYVGNYSPDVYAKLWKRREDISNGASSCKKLIKSGDSCFVGVESDQSYCGFAGDDKIAQMYCKDYPTATCCSKMNSNSKLVQSSHQPPSQVQSLYDSARHVAMIWGITAHPLVETESLDTPSNSSNEWKWDRTKIIIVSIFGSLVGLGLLSGLGLYLYRKREHSRRTSSRFRRLDSKDTTPILNEKVLWKVVYSFTPNLPDELKLNVGDSVHVEYPLFNVRMSYEDGWAKAKNLVSGLEGACPMGCLERIKD